MNMHIDATEHAQCYMRCMRALRHDHATCHMRGDFPPPNGCTARRMVGVSKAWHIRSSPPMTQRRAYHAKWRDANGVSTTVVIGMHDARLNGTAIMSPTGIGLTSHTSAVATVDNNVIRNQSRGGNILAMSTNIGAHNHMYKTQVRRRISANRLCGLPIACKRGTCGTPNQSGDESRRALNGRMPQRGILPRITHRWINHTRINGVCVCVSINSHSYHASLCDEPRGRMVALM